MIDIKMTIAFNLDDFPYKLSLTNPVSSAWCCSERWKPECVSGYFNALLFVCDIYCQHFEEFSEGSDRTISAAALLSPVWGRVYINTEKHPENIVFPIGSGGSSLKQTNRGSSRKWENLLSDSFSRKSGLMGNCWGMWLWRCDRVS